jgi:cell division protein FtsQ
VEARKRYGIKNILLMALWICIGAGVAVLLVAAMRKKDAQHCKAVEVDIKGVNTNYFVDKADILNAIAAIAKGNPVGQSTGSFDLKRMEAELLKNAWVRSAELFFDNNEVLQVKVHEREPLARVFTTTATTFYIDDDISMLPVSDKFSARLPVFTGFPSDRKVLSAADSNLLRDVKTISLAIQKDSFRVAMIDQVDITPQRTFEMIPKIGNQVIIFGDAADAEEKFRKLELFYKRIMIQAGWNRYSIINVQYKNQVLAKIRGAEDFTADSLRTLQIMQLIAANAEKAAADSLQNKAMEAENVVADSTMVQQSIQRDAITEPSNSNEDQQPVLNSGDPNAVNKEPKQNVIPVKKPTPLKKTNKLPKATMPKRNVH